MDFNQVVGLDLFFFKFRLKTKIFLNVVCWGTSLQVVEEMPEKSASRTFETFSRCWLRPFGLQTVLVADQGTELTGQDFAARLAFMGVAMHLTDARSPWQAARTEKMGGVFKDKLQLVIDEVRAISEQDFQACVTETLMARNRYRYYNRSGFSPYQRVFGYNPRLPASLASDDILSPCLLSESAIEPVQRTWEIRSAASKAWVSQLNKEAVKRGLATTTRQSDIKNLSDGDWVFVWRNTVDYRGWSGPAVLLTASPNGKSGALGQSVERASSSGHLGGVPGGRTRPGAVSRNAAEHP